MGERGPANCEEEITRLEHEVHNLRAALVSRATINQAIGVIMATRRCGPEEAFNLLVQQSQHENRKLREIAAELVAQQQPGRSGS